MLAAGFTERQIAVHTANEPDPDLLALANDEEREVLIFKMAVALGELTEKIKGLMDEIQASMAAAAAKYVEENTTEVATWEQFKDVLETKKGFIAAGWDGTKETEALIKGQPVSESEYFRKCLREYRIFTGQDAQSDVLGTPNGLQSGLNGR